MKVHPKYVKQDIVQIAISLIANLIANAFVVYYECNRSRSTYSRQSCDALKMGSCTFPQVPVLHPVNHLLLVIPQHWMDNGCDPCHLCTLITWGDTGWLASMMSQSELSQILLAQKRNPVILQTCLKERVPGLIENSEKIMGERVPFPGQLIWLERKLSERNLKLVALITGLL